MTADELRSARLLFAGELAAGTITEADLGRREVALAVASANVPSFPARVLQRRAMKRGRLSFERDVAGPFGEARRAVLGDAAAGPPRLLIRIDEFPHYRARDLPDRYGTEAYARFHAIMRDAGVHYLVAVTPRVPREGLDPKETAWRAHTADEQEMLRTLRADGVAFGVHGLDHRTRHASSRRHSELLGLSRDALRERLDAGQAVLRDAALDARVFVAPYNRFSRRQYPVLAERFDVVTGGPESVPLLGWHRTPLWRGGAVYLPSYAPLYGTAATVTPEIERLGARCDALWLPVVLHWGWEADEGWDDLKRLAEAAAPYAAPWQDFLDTVERTKDTP